MRKQIETERRVIPDYIAGVPSIQWLRHFTTQEQFDEWYQLKLIFSFVSLAWEARHTGQNDPIEPFVKHKIIKPNYRDTIWLMVDVYEQLWGLVQLSYSYVKAELKKQKIENPFDSAAELFAYLVAEEANAPLNNCLRPYYESSKSKWRKYMELFLEECEGELAPVDENKQIALHKQLFPEGAKEWAAFVLDVAESKTNKGRNVALKAKLEDYQKSRQRFILHGLSVTTHSSCCGWKQGRRLVSRRGGSYFAL